MTPEQIKQALAETRRTLPVLPLLNGLCTDPVMFNSRDRFKAVGFSLVDHADNKMMVGSHKAAVGYLFKKYNNAKSGDEQLRNYMRRFEGAKLLRTFIAERHLQHVVAPKKWLYELPSSFWPARHIIIAEKLDLVSKKKTERNYDHISKEQTRELATVLYYFRGLNSTAANLPYTTDGKIAFIDTERWDHDKEYLLHVGDRLPSKRRKLAWTVYEELSQQGAQRLRSAL